MRRSELAHLLRAAATIAGDGRILVVGSQAILGSHAEDELPVAAWISIEADLVFLDPASGPEKADQVDGAIGELSHFHAQFSYYAQGVDMTTAKLPAGWKDRVVEFQPADSAPATAVCLDKHDLVISKLVAMREKDLEFAMALLKAGLLATDVLRERAAALDSVPPPTRRRVQGWIDAAADRLSRLSEPDE